MAINSCSVLAEEPKPAPEALDYSFQNVENTTVKDSLDVLATTQTTLGRYVHTAGEKIDLFFGNENSDLINKGSQLKVYLPFRFYERQDFETSLNFSLHLELPRTNRRWNLFVSSYQQSVADSNQTERDSSSLATSTAQNESQNEIGSLGLFYDLFEDKNIVTKLDFGVNVLGLTDLDPFIRLRARHHTALSVDITSSQTQRIYWEGRDGYTWDMRQVFDLEQSEKNLIRSRSAARWWITGEALEFNQRFSIFHTVSKRRILGYYAYWQWDDSLGPMQQTEIATGVNVRDKLYKDWLYGEIEPKLTWRVEDHFKRSEFSILFMLEMIFYGE